MKPKSKPPLLVLVLIGLVLTSLNLSAFPEFRDLLRDNGTEPPVDPDTDRILKMIFEDKIERAKAEIAIFLDDHPGHPRASWWRKVQKEPQAFLQQWCEVRDIVDSSWITLVRGDIEACRRLYSKLIQENPLAFYNLEELSKVVDDPQSFAVRLTKARERATRDDCYINLESIGVESMSWAIRNNWAFPFEISQGKGGTLEIRKVDSDGFDANSAQHYASMSDQFPSPKILICPADAQRKAAENFQSLREENVTYTLRSGASAKGDPSGILARCPYHGYLLLVNGKVLTYRIADSTTESIIQLIREGKRNDARQQLKRFVLANPRDPKTTELRKLWQSLGGETTAAPPAPRESKVTAQAATSSNAGISDSDLAKVTQLIQEGKTAGAKAEITTLLDKNPNDPRADKLKKLLKSLEGSVESPESNRAVNPVKNSNSSHNAPSIEESMAWIIKNLPSEFNNYSFSSGRQDNTCTYMTRVAAVDINGGWLQIVTKKDSNDSWKSEDGNSDSKGEDVECSWYRVALKDLYIGGSTVTLRESWEKAALQTGILTVLRAAYGGVLNFKAKENSVIVSNFEFGKSSDRFERNYSKSYAVNGKEASATAYKAAHDGLHLWLQNPLKAPLEPPQGLAWKSERKASGLSIPVSEELAPRMQSALDHLIRLSGGTDKPREAF